MAPGLSRISDSSSRNWISRTACSMADRFFDEAMFRYDPVAGTAAGFHQYDTKLPVMSRSELDALTAVLHRFEQEVDGFGATGLSPLASADRELLLSQIRGQLLMLE